MSSYIGNGQAINFHYLTDFLGEYQSKLFYKIFEPGVINRDIENYIVYNNDTITIKKGLSIFVLASPGVNPLTSEDRGDILLKIDTTEDYDIIVDNSYIGIKKLIYRFNWIWTEYQSGEFIQGVDTINTNDIILCEFDYDNKQLIFNNTIFSQFNTTIDIPLSSDKVAGYDSTEGTGNNGTVAIPINNLLTQYGLNAEKLNGRTLNELALKDGTLQNSLNADKLGDGEVGYEANKYSLSDNINTPPNLNVNLNTKQLNSQNSNAYSEASHTHSYDDISETTTYGKVINVNQNNLVSDGSFENGAFIYSKMKKDGDGASQSTLGRQKNIKIEVGRIQIPNNGSFDINFQTAFVSQPSVAIQLVDYAGQTWEVNANYAFKADLSLVNNQTASVTIIRAQLGSYTYNGGSCNKAAYKDTSSFAGRYIYYIAVGEV